MADRRRFWSTTQWRKALLPDRGMAEAEGLAAGTGLLTGSATYKADGTFTLTGTLQVMAQGIPLTIQVDAGGTYTINKLSETSFSLVPNGKVTMTVPGYPPQVDALTDATSYVMIDQDTIKDADGTISKRVK